LKTVSTAKLLTIGCGNLQR